MSIRVREFYMRGTDMERTFVDRMGYRRYRSSGELVDGWAKEFRANRPFFGR